MKPGEVKKILERHKNKYAVFAFRVTESEKWKAGDVLSPSRRWWDGEPVYLHAWIREEEAPEYEAKGYAVYKDRDSWCYHNLSYMLESDFDHVIAVNEKAYMMEAGVCGIRLTSDSIKESLALIAKYKGDQLLIIGGQNWMEGYDKGEVVIPNARVIAARKRPRGRL